MNITKFTKDNEVLIQVHLTQEELAFKRPELTIGEIHDHIYDLLFEPELEAKERHVKNLLIEIIPKDRFTGYDDTRAWGDMAGVYVGYMDANIGNGTAFACFSDSKMAAELVMLWNRKCVQVASDKEIEYLNHIRIFENRIRSIVEAIGLPDYAGVDCDDRIEKEIMRLKNVELESKFFARRLFEVSENVEGK